MSRFFYVCLFSPFRDAIKGSWSASYVLKSVLRWELNIISCVWNIPLLYYITEGTVRQTFLNIVTFWNADLANLTMAFPSTEVLRNVSFVENNESWDSQDISLSGVMFEWSMLHGASSFNYLWEGLGAIILGTCCILFSSADRPLNRLLWLLQKERQLWGWWCHLCLLCCLTPLWNVAWTPCVLC